MHTFGIRKEFYYNTINNSIDRNQTFWAKILDYKQRYWMIMEPQWHMHPFCVAYYFSEEYIVSFFVIRVDEAT